MEKPPIEFKDISIRDELFVTLPAFCWIQVAEWISTTADNGPQPHGVSQLMDQLGNIFMTPASVKSLTAYRAHQATQSNPIAQIFGGMMVSPETEFDNDE